MGIIFELEDDEEYDIVFEPDFDIPDTLGNRSDQTQVQWQLSEWSNQGIMANLFGNISVESPFSESDDQVGDLRLLL